MFLGPLKAFVESLIEQGEKRDAALTKALKAILGAALQTKQYLVAVAGGQEMTAERDAAVCELWKNAAVALRPVEPGLAQICFAKAEYWAAPDQWEGTGATT